MNPRPQAPAGEAPNQDPVDWRARSQVLEEAGEALASAYRAMHPDPSDSHVALERWDALVLSLGLPDEEGEERIENPAWWHEAGIANEPVHGAAPPPRGAAREGASEGGGS